MAKATPQTVETGKSVTAFVNTIDDKQRREDCFAIIEIMKQASGYEPKMWGPAIIGFGSYHYVYDSGHEGDAPLVGFSPRKSAFALYIANFDGKEELLAQFGKHTRAKFCVYIKKLQDVNPTVLKKLAAGTVKYCKAKYK
jgi:hypothetical protein